MSASARRKIAAAQRARWAKVRRETKLPERPEPVVSRKQSRGTAGSGLYGLSAAERKKIVSFGLRQ
jgi:hypothetical protein